MSDITINDVKFRTGKIPALDQIKIVKRIFPLISGLGAAFDQMNNGAGGVWSALGPMGDAVSKMPDADSDFVIKMCLGVCQKYHEVPGESGGQWRRVISDGVVMFDDLDMGTILQLTFAVLQENLGTFFPIPAGGAQGEQQPVGPLN